MLEIVCWTKKFRWGFTNLWIPYSRKSYRFSMFEATSSNVSSWQGEPKIFLRIHQRSWPRDIRSMEWGNWTFLSCIQRWKFTIGQSPRHFILQPSCDSCDHFSYLGFMEKKKSMWFKTFWGFNHSESPVLRSPVKPQPKMRNFTTDSQSPII